MGFFSKVWKGVKKVVKKVAKHVKKTTKMIVKSMPGGDKLWKIGTKVGTAVKKGFGKFASAIGPVGMMVLSFVLAPIFAPMLAAMWSGFGAAAAGMAASGSAIVSALGTAGTAIFNGVTFVAGELGALGNAITKGIGEVAKGNFGAAGDVFMSNMKSVFSGEAGKTAVHKATMSFTGNVSTDVLAKAGELNTDFGLVDAGGKTLNPSAADFIPKPSTGLPTDLGTLSSSVPQGIVGPPVPTAAVPSPLGLEGPVIDLNAPMGLGTLAKPNTQEFGEAAKFTGTEPAKPGILDKAQEGLATAKKLLGTSGGGSGGTTGLDPFDVGARRTDVSNARRAEAIRAAGGGGNIFERIIAQAGQQGGF